MTEIFDINPTIKIEKEILDNKPIYKIENFYKNPFKVKELILSSNSLVHKFDQKPSYNQIYFDDRRAIIASEKINLVYKFLGKLCNQNPLDKFENYITANLFKLYTNPFNDYKNNYWWPHIDEGYTGILYLNHDSEYGTNLYKIINHDEEPQPPICNEHYSPWRKKNNYEIIKSIKPNFNKMVLFDANYFFHGVDICGKRYFKSEYRLNQVFFFKKNTFQVKY